MPEQSAGTPQSVAASAQQLPPAIRELHRAVLRSFRDRGRAHRDDLHPAAAALGIKLDDALHQLAIADLVHTAPDGQIEIAYPFSGLPTGHTVHLPGHPSVAAMCAIDALGMSAMLGRPVTITAAEPDTGRIITVAADGSRARWRPRTAVVFAGSAGLDAPPPRGHRPAAHPGRRSRHRHRRVRQAAEGRAITPAPRSER